MPDLTTTYLGLPLRSPLVCSASPLCEGLDNLRRMEAAGAGAVVLHSLFEEQVPSEGSRGARPYLVGAWDRGQRPADYLEHVRLAKAALGIPVLGSLNGVSRGGWVDYARRIQEAGADALELNVYSLPADAERTGAEVEQWYVDLVREVASGLHLPVAVKLSPYFTAPAAFACRLDRAGARGLVLFNRFYQPDFDPATLTVLPRLELSTPQELRLRLHWVAILHGKVRADLAVTGGVHSALDAVKSLMAGARVAMMTSALLQHGIDHLRSVRDDLDRWLADNGHESLSRLQGAMSLRLVAHPTALERAYYIKELRAGPPTSPPQGLPPG